MRDIFASLYETVFGLYDSQFSLIFDTLYDNGGYFWLGLTLIVIPFLLWLLFYRAWQYPYGRFWHWFGWLVIISLIIAFVAWAIADNKIFMSDNQALNGALDDPETGYKHFAQSLPLQYAWINGALAVVLGFVYSLLLKQFSKLQIHLPF